MVDSPRMAISVGGPRADALPDEHFCLLREAIQAPLKLPEWLLLNIEASGARPKRAAGALIANRQSLRAARVLS
jgi:hypothetical protein